MEKNRHKEISVITGVNGEMVLMIKLEDDEKLQDSVIGCYRLIYNIILNTPSVATYISRVIEEEQSLLSVEDKSSRLANIIAVKHSHLLYRYLKELGKDEEINLVICLHDRSILFA